MNAGERSTSSWVLVSDYKILIKEHKKGGRLPSFLPILFLLFLFFQVLLFGFHQCFPVIVLYVFCKYNGV